MAEYVFEVVEYREDQLVSPDLDSVGNLDWVHGIAAVRLGHAEALTLVNWWSVVAVVVVLFVVVAVVVASSFVVVDSLQVVG